MKADILLWVFFGLYLEVAPLRRARQNNTMSKILDVLLDKESYDPRLRPNYDGGPVDVKIGFWVLSIDAIDVINMDFSLDIFLRQQWVDDRLNHGLNKTMSLSNTVMGKIWMPDSYFVNAKQGSFHKVTTDNMMIMILPGGVVKYNARVTIRASCPMDLRDFPMDTQHCSLILESYGYSTRHIRFKWEVNDGNGMHFVPASVKMLPQYILTELKLTELHTAYVVGNWTSVVASFTFERLYSYFLIHVYGPCSLIVMISWIGFLLPREQPPARITLGVTAVLTVVTILNMLNNSMPKVNYVKTIDKYLIGCFLFVFSTLLEYAIVLFLDAGRKRRLRNDNAKKKKKKKKQSKKKHCDSLLDIQYCSSTAYNDNYQKITKEESVNINGNILESIKTPGGAENLNNDSDFETALKKGPQLISIVERIRNAIYSDSFIISLDEIALIVFPLVFAVFNAIYWLSVLHGMSLFS